MHSRLNIPAPAGIKVKNDAERKVTMSSKDPVPRLRPKYAGGFLCLEKFAVVSPTARTVNRHRWVSVNALRRARETSLRNSAH